MHNEAREWAQRLQRARIQRGIEVPALAALAGCTVATVMALEAGAAQPLPALVRVATLLGLSQSGGPPATRAGRRPAEAGAAIGVVVENLAPGAQALTARLVTAAPGCGSATLVPAADETLLFVLDGQVDVVAGDRLWRLRPGDSLTLAAGQNHGYANPGPQPCRLLAVSR